MQFSKKEIKRQAIVEVVADYVLREGLQRASLRSLAAAVDTSDRMLLHYFRDKDELIAAALSLVNQRLVSILDASQPEPMPMASLLKHLAAMLQDSGIQPFIKLWLEMAAQAAGGDMAARTAAQTIGRDFLTWISAALTVSCEDERPRIAALTMATLDGMVLLDALGFGTEVTRALEALDSPTVERGRAKKNRRK